MALSRLALVHDRLARGELVEPGATAGWLSAPATITTTASTTDAPHAPQ